MCGFAVIYLNVLRNAKETKFICLEKKATKSKWLKTQKENHSKTTFRCFIGLAS